MFKPFGSKEIKMPSPGHECPEGGAHAWRMSDGCCAKCGMPDPRDPHPTR